MSLKPQVIIAIAAVILLIYAAFAFDLPYRNKVDDFETCAAAGNPVMESYPRQCRDKKGNLYVEEVPVTPAPVETGTSTATSTDGTSTSPVSQKACRPTGCSGQICSDEDMASTCEFRAEYMCYKSAVCERQKTGLCGWTETASLRACLTNPPRTE